jgi:hypothetical protein
VICGRKVRVPFALSQLSPAIVPMKFGNLNRDLYGFVSG